MQVSNISFSNPQYPDLLRNISDPPKSINVLGTLPKGIYVAIVGTRKATSYGEKVTYQLASELAAAGAVIVSGLAIGLDGVAHRAALEAGGKAVAVLAHGLDQVYPARHRGLARDILANGGALVSEYEAGEQPLPFHFVERNRIIAGLSVALIVTEAAAKSGSLITANFANDAGRTVMAVPGNITSAFSAGPNNLIRSGAKAVVSSADVLTELGFATREAVPVSAQSPDEAKIIALLETGTSSNDELIAHTGLSAAQFANIISLMEITGKVRNLGAGQWVRR